MRIGFLSTDWGDHLEYQPGGCTNVRMMTPSKALNTIGHETFVGEIGWDDKQGFVAVHPRERLIFKKRGVITSYEYGQDKLDVVVLKLFMHKDASKYIKMAQGLGQTVIIDTDDHFEELPKDNLAFHTTDPEKYPENNRSHMIASYSVADGIIASTDFLEKRMRQYNDNVYQVYNSLDPKDFMYRLDFSGNKPTVGWVGIMMWRVDDIKDVAGALRTVINQYDLKFHHSGIMLDKPQWIAETLGVDPNKISGFTGARPQYYANVFMPIDIGIVPLTKNNFNQAKSNLKGLEYALSGIPFVSSDTNEYKKLHSMGAGRVAKTSKDWIKHLKQLVDPEVREIERQKNFKVALENYNIFTVKYKWSEAIELIHMNSQSDTYNKTPLLKV